MRDKTKPAQSRAQLPAEIFGFLKGQMNKGPSDLEAVFQTAPVGLCVFDRNLRYVRINEKLANINGLPVEEHIGKSVREVVPELAEKAERITEQIFRTGEPVTDAEFSGRTPAEPEAKHWWLEHWLPLKNKRGEITGINVAVKDITRQRQAEKAAQEINQTLEKRIHESTEELNSTIEELKKTKNYLLQAHRIANLGIWNWDIRNNKLWWSDVVYRIFGTVPEKSDATYEWFLSFVHPDDVDSVKQSVNKALEGKENYSVEHRVIRPDGNERIVKQRAEMIFDAAGTPVRMAGTIQDVTEDKRKEDRLHEQAVELKSQGELLDLAHDTIIVNDLDGRIIFWNKGAENTYGWKKEEVLGKVSHQILKTRFREPFLKIISSVSSKGNWEGELINTSKDGRKLTLESRWALQRDEKGKPSAILEIDRDITQRKSAERRTEEARRFAESIIETVQEALVVLDPELKVLSANRTFYELFDRRPEETEGEYIYQLDEGRWDITGLRKLLQDVLPKNTSFEDVEMEYTPPKGPARTLLLNARRIYRDRKKTEMILLAMQDITVRKRQEKTIRELTEELLLAEEQQRQKVATTLHDTLGQMLAFSRRELSSLLKNPELRTDVKLRKVLDSINKSVRQSRKLTADLSSPTLHTFGLEAGLEELAEQFSNENGIHCSFNSTEEPKPLEKKVELLVYRSVKELLFNIAKHAKAKNACISAGTADNLLEIKVTDDGEGFDTSRLNVNNFQKHSFGLFSIRQRLTNVGGSFNIESEKGKGTRVTLQAPLKKAENNKEG